MPLTHINRNQSEIFLMVDSRIARMVCTAALLEFAACNQTNQQTAAPGDTATASAAEAVPATGIPPALDQAEGLAEDIQDEIDGGNWAAATAKMKEMKAIRASLDAQVPFPDLIGRYGVSVDSLAALVSAHNRPDALGTANGISRTLTVMFSRFTPRVPIQVAYMDVAGRDLVYAAERGDWRWGAQVLSELQTNYAGVADHVSGANSALAQRVTSEIAQLERSVQARDAGPTEKTARVLLEEVDAIELTY